MFLDFFYRLRSHGVPVTTHNWMALMQALGDGLHDDSLDGFYAVARCLLVSSESHYDAFDLAFGETFKGVVHDLQSVLQDLDEWLRDPKKLEFLDPELARALQGMSLQELRAQLAERLAQQKGRHEGGNRWIGTGGTSPFGQGGQHPTGVRIGGQGGGRSALAVADARRFRAYRRDVVLDTRQMAAALRRLRKMGRKGNEEELDLDATIDATARNAGDLEIEMRPVRRNDVRVILLMDVGGSMDPFARLVSRLFSAAHQGGGFRQLEAFYFHNCVYDYVYRDVAFRNRVGTAELLRTYEPHWRLIIVGDAYMHPGELTMSSASWWVDSPSQTAPSGMTWLAKLADRFGRAAWLNPEATDLWGAPTIRSIAQIFPMFPLSLEGLDEMVEHLRKPPHASRSTQQRELVRELARRGDDEIP